MLPLFLVSTFSLAFETFLTRFFAVAALSTYSYWIISIALFGYSVSGVILTMAKSHFSAMRPYYLRGIPPLLLCAAAAAFLALRANPFNPLALQNDVLWKGQIANIFLYYAGLFPVFFLSGLFVGLTFMAHDRDVPRVYAADLLGAACGALLMLGAMFLLSPYHLLAAALPVLLIVVVIDAIRTGVHGHPRWLLPAVLAVGVLGTAWGLFSVLHVSSNYVPFFKQLKSVLNIAGAREVARVRAPSGSYVAMSDYAEYDDVNMTNNYTTLGIGSPPKSYGLYRDGERITSLLAGPPADTSYVRGSLSYFPLVIRPHPSELLIGTNGGYRIIERSQASHLVALEPERVIYNLVQRQLSKLPQSRLQSSLRGGPIFAALRKGGARFDIVEVSLDFLRQDENNRYAFTREAVDSYLRKLSPDGILSVAVDISEFTYYALKVVNTITAGLHDLGVTDPAACLIVYRSAWVCQILAARHPFSQSDIKALLSYCDDRSFDTSYFPGIRPKTVKVWNNLPPVTFNGTVHSPEGGTPQDSLRDDLVRMLTVPGGKPALAGYFDFSPSTFDRPSFNSISRLSRVRSFLTHVSELPAQEIGYLMNLLVLGQALLLAVLILLLPLAGGRRSRPGVGARTFIRMSLYFSALGLGFLFVELTLIEKASFFLGSDTSAFACVLSGMLVFSGLGSLYSSRMVNDPWKGTVRALPVLLITFIVLMVAVDPLMVIAIGLSPVLKTLILLAAIAPASFAMGRFFPLGNASLGAWTGSLIPWAWAVNGAFSVVATPLANILSTRVGWRVVVAIAMVLYLSTVLTFPVKSPPAAKTAEVRT